MDEAQQLGIPGTIQLWFLPGKVMKHSYGISSQGHIWYGADSILEEAKI